MLPENADTNPGIKKEQKTYQNSCYDINQMKMKVKTLKTRVEEK